MKKITTRVIALSILLFLGSSLFAQFSFTNSNTLLSTTSNSGCAVTVVDLNNDGLDDLVKMDQSTDLVVDMQNQNGTFTNYYLGNISGTSKVWGMAVADVDHNGWKDVATGTYGAMYVVKLSWNGTTIVPNKVLLGGSYFVQNITFGDINNDGWVDLAVCDDNDYMKIYQNNSGNLSLTTTLMNTNINPGLTVGGDPYDSGNYGSVWTDFDNDGDLDLYIAHCRQAASSASDMRRRDRLFVNNGSNVYAEMAANYNIEPTAGTYKQTWTTSFGDLDNDGDQDIVMTNHGENGQILQNDGTGHYTDVTAGSGYNTTFDPIESIVEDFDNDGFLDILISGPGFLMYKNNGNGTFTSVSNPFSGSSFLSFATGDLNHDGKVDLLASYGQVYNNPTNIDDVLYLNTTNNTNHFINFDLRGTASNKGGIGAKVTIYGSFGKKVREIRSGETYGTSNTLTAHFGLGQSTTIDSAVVKWPSGIVTRLGQLSADQFVTQFESGCSITGNIISGTGVLCTGQSTILTAPAGYSSYLWSNGATTNSITVNTTGNYNVAVTSSGGCNNVSPLFKVSLNPNETPIVTSSSTVNNCAGNISLSSSSAASYLWSGPNGFSANTQTIVPPASGAYSVTIQGVCGIFTSAASTVNVLAAPAPLTTGATGVGPISLSLSAAGSGGTLSWYDQATNGNLIATGASYTTPTLTVTTTYYVDETTAYPGNPGQVGPKYHSGNNFFSATTTNGSVNFNVLNNCTLKTVKVYTDSTKVRQIQLKNSAGTVIQSLSTNLIGGDTTILNLNWPLTTGNGYVMTTNASVNMANFGFNSPRMLRSNQNVSYPYTLGNFVSLTGSNQGSNVYYYFYDWKLESPSFNCVSARIPVDATISGLTGISSIANNSNSDVVVYPNPASNNLQVRFEIGNSSISTIQMMDVTGRIISTYVVEKPFQGQNVSLDLTGINSGSYFVRIQNNNKVSIQKIVIEK
jgi:ASPIC and UnbV/Secretion system C-terminal sorting domain/Ig-like domain CHU_C associated/FG-GAP-like repeat